MRTRLFVIGVAISAAVLLTFAQAPGGRQSQGALGNRPGAERTPEFPVPSIRDYKPASTLVVPEHPVPKAKFPVIDIHSHQPAPIDAAQLATVVRSMDSLNLRVLVNASGGYFWRTFETADEYFDYYRDYHAFWKLYGLNLPDAVLRKLYYQNALNLLPGMPRTGFPG